MTLRLDLMRHGDTLGPQGFRGRLDFPLSALGWAQMRSAVQSVGAWTLVVSSPLVRCLAFAKELAEQRGLPVLVEPGLRELDFGDWEGLDSAQVLAQDPAGLKRFFQDPFAYTPPGGEPLMAFQERVLASTARLTEVYAGQRLLVVSHGGVLRLLMALARGMPAQELLKVSVDHAQLFGVSAHLNGAALCLEESPCVPS